MAFTHGSVQSDTARKEQIITEFFAKSLHIILESRVPFMSSRNYSGEQVVSSPSSSSSSSSSYRPRDKWFNPALRECPDALENIDFWRQSNLDPMVVDVVLVQCPLHCEPENYSAKGDLSKNLCLTEQNLNCLNLEPEDYASVLKTEKVIERWVVVYESKKSRESGSASKRAGGNFLTLYKKSTLLLRSLYVTLRLLPAYKLFRDLISSGQIRTYTLKHHLNSFVEPFTQGEEADMQRVGFTPVETSCGRLCMSVSYKSSLLNLNSEASTPISPQFIPDYVGSPLADPLKRFPYLPVSRSSPSYSPFSRLHSWSCDVSRASPQSILPSPSTTYSDSHASIAESNTRRTPLMSLPHHFPGATQANTKYTGYDEYLPSPAFSPSNSPSPPMYNHPGDPSPSLLRCESAPVRIPAAKDPSSALVLSSKQVLPPSPPLRGRRYGVKTDKHSGSSSLMDEKLSFGKDESGRSGLRLSSCISPQVSVPRNSHELCYPDDYDKFKLACHFAVDEDDLIDPGSRGGSFDQRGQPSDQFEQGGSAHVQKSQNAALGALVLMLNKAAPLRQDFIGPENQPSSTISGPATTSTAIIEGHGQNSRVVQSTTLCSNITARKTTADALAELREYKEVKQELIRQGR